MGVRRGTVGQPPGGYTRSVQSAQVRTTTSSLPDVALFGGLTDDERAALLARLRPRRYRKGATVFLFGELGRDLYIIESGSVRIYVATADGKELTLAILGPGEFFGELALLDGEPRSSDAIIMEDSQLQLLERDEFVHFMDDHPSVAHRVIEVLSRRLRNNNELVQDAAFFDVAARLARVILRLAESVGQPDGNEGITISKRLTQHDLAGMIGASRESVNKWLAFFARQGLVAHRGGLIRVLNAEGLRKRIY
jgi:CRP/FNR family cyclic AMP-dependent transcriptional regulator